MAVCGNAGAMPPAQEGGLLYLTLSSLNAPAPKDCVAQGDAFCVFSPNARLPGGAMVSVVSVARWLDGMDHLFAGGVGELDWPDSADKANIDFLFGDYEGWWPIV